MEFQQDVLVGFFYKSNIDALKIVFFSIKKAPASMRCWAELGRTRSSSCSLQCGTRFSSPPLASGSRIKRSTDFFQCLVHPVKFNLLYLEWTATEQLSEEEHRQIQRSWKSDFSSRTFNLFRQKKKFIFRNELLIMDLFFRAYFYSG